MLRIENQPDKNNILNTFGCNNQTMNKPLIEKNPI